MKYVILIGDGMGDYPIPELGGKTPLEAAATPNLDELARRGELGLVPLQPDDDGLHMEDYAAGHISSEEAKELITALEASLGRNGRHFYPGVSYRHLLVWAQ